LNQLIVDGFALAYRSHFAFKNLCTSKGLSSGCVYGFLTSLRSRKNSPFGQRITIAWDTEAVRKKALFADYKAQRSKVGISEQIGDLKKMLSCLNIFQAEYQGEEADDVLATLVRKYVDQGDSVFVLSSDKDLLQFIKDGAVVMIRPKAGQVQERYYDEEMVRKEFGVGPKGVASFLAFKGDTVDNIPGVPRLRSAVIASLIEKYGSPEAVYHNLDKEQLTDFERASLKKSEQQVLLNYQLTQLKDDLELNIIKGHADPVGLQGFLDKYEIKFINSERYIEIFNTESSFQSRTSDLTTPSLF